MQGTTGIGYPASDVWRLSGSTPNAGIRVKYERFTVDSPRATASGGDCRDPGVVVAEKATEVIMSWIHSTKKTIRKILNDHGIQTRIEQSWKTKSVYIIVVNRNVTIRISDHPTGDLGVDVEVGHYLQAIREPEIACREVLGIIGVEPKRRLLEQCTEIENMKRERSERLRKQYLLAQSQEARQNVIRNAAEGLCHSCGKELPVNRKTRRKWLAAAEDMIQGAA